MKSQFKHHKAYSIESIKDLKYLPNLQAKKRDYQTILPSSRQNQLMQPEQRVSTAASLNKRKKQLFNRNTLDSLRNKMLSRNSNTRAILKQKESITQANKLQTTNSDQKQVAHQRYNSQHNLQEKSEADQNNVNFIRLMSQSNYSNSFQLPKEVKEQRERLQQKIDLLHILQQYDVCICPDSDLVFNNQSISNLFWFDIFDENFKEYKGKNIYQFQNIHEKDKKKDINIFEYMNKIYMSKYKVDKSNSINVTKNQRDSITDLIKEQPQTNQKQDLQGGFQDFVKENDLVSKMKLGIQRLLAKYRQNNMRKLRSKISQVQLSQDDANSFSFRKTYQSEQEDLKYMKETSPRKRVILKNEKAETEYEKQVYQRYENKLKAINIKLKKELNNDQVNQLIIQKFCSENKRNHNKSKDFKKQLQIIKQRNLSKKQRNQQTVSFEEENKSPLYKHKDNVMAKLFYEDSLNYAKLHSKFISY